MTTEGGGMMPSRDAIAAAIRQADGGGWGSTIDHDEAAENVLDLFKALMAENECLREELAEAEHQIATCDQAELRVEVERLTAGIRAEKNLHFKVQDKHGQENAGPPYCAADDIIWPCPIRKRLEAVLGMREGRHDRTPERGDWRGGGRRAC